ncbi:hypothetical protein D1872_280130 [compost metagenome]
MHSDHALRIHRRTRDLRQAERRCVAGQNNIAWTNLIELFEYLPLGIQILRNGLDDHIAGTEFGKMRHFMNFG